MSAWPPDNRCRTAIIGLGLIGGSLAAALRRARPAWTIVGFDASDEARRRAVARSLVHEAAGSRNEALHGADVVVLATPVGAILDMLGDLDRLVPGETVVLDVGSTKGRIVEAMRQLPSRMRAVGGHPMTGALTAGTHEPTARLFAGCRFVLTPVRPGDATVEWARALVRDIGAEPVTMEAAAHDDAVALVSHLPYLLSVPLLDAYDEADAVTQSLAAGGFRACVHGAGGDAAMWADVLASNRDSIQRALRAYRARLDALDAAVGSAGRDELRALLDRAAERVRRV